MSLFNRILNFQKRDLKAVERRFGKRFTVAPSFPLKASLTIGDCPCSGRVYNVSAEGLGFLTDRDPGAEVAGRPVRVAFGLEEFALSIDGEVRHVRRVDKGFVCGVALTFEEFEVRKSYLQLMLPLVVGASLHRLDEALVRQDEAEFHKTVFSGESLSRLIVWARRDAAHTPDSFELRMDEYFVKGRAQTRALQTFALSEDGRPHRGRELSPLPFVSDDTGGEIRQLFCWSVQNMQDNVPAGTRAFLGSFLD